MKILLTAAGFGLFQLLGLSIPAMSNQPRITCKYYLYRSIKICKLITKDGTEYVLPEICSTELNLNNLVVCKEFNEKK